MSPLYRAELNVFAQMAADLEQWAGAINAHSAKVRGTAGDLGPPWDVADLGNLERAFARMAAAFNSLRNQAYPLPATGAQPRPELVILSQALSEVAGHYH